MKILIKNGRLIDPATGRDEKGDLFINDSLIEKIDKNIRAKADDVVVIDGTGYIVSPGLIDIHCHLREPGFEYKETIATGTMAAARGGFTSVVCMANTDPVNDTKSVTEYILERAAREGSARVYPCGAITKGLKGEELAEIGEMFQAGIVAISDDGKSVKNAGLLRRALEYARIFAIPAISHCEDTYLASGYVHEGEASVLSGLEASPALAEEIIVTRDIALARYTSSPLHLTHLSAAGSIDAVRQAKRVSPLITADTCPHYFTLTDMATVGFDTHTKVNPPLRSRQDMEAIREGLRDDTIDVIATDHAPHEQTSKNVEYNLASYGISGFETALGLSLGLVHDGVLTLPRLLAKMTANPARILNIPGGTMEPGSPGDIILFSMNAEWVVERKDFLSKGKNTPFQGRRLKGRNALTIVGGRIVYSDDRILPV